MVKSTNRFSWARHDRSTSVFQKLSEDNQCYVLITCGEPKDGQIEVEMTYGGYGEDPALAAYLVESASSIINEVL